MELPADLERFVPAWETPLLSLHEASAEMLTQLAGAVGWALRVLQAEKAPMAEIERVLGEAMAGLEGLSAEQAGQWKRVAWFFLLLVYHRREERELVDQVLDSAKQSKFHEREEVAAMGLTVAEQLRVEAEVDATRLALEKVLLARFGPLPEPVVAALRTADLETMNAWLWRASTAPALEDVGIVS